MFPPKFAASTIPGVLMFDIEKPSGTFVFGACWGYCISIRCVIVFRLESCSRLLHQSYLLLQRSRKAAISSFIASCTSIKRTLALFYITRHNYASVSLFNFAKKLNEITYIFCMFSQRLFNHSINRNMSDYSILNFVELASI